jgi:P27 family predicted phage terminase small subunit
MANPRKPSDKRQNRVTKDVSGLVPIGHPQGQGLDSNPAPKPPVPVSAKVRRYWQAYWSSPVSQVVDPNVDAFLLVRWITYVDEWETATKTLHAEGMTVVGSTGQTVLHPLARLRASLETELSAIEQRLGLDPKSRALLGIAVNQYKKSASDLVADIATLAPVSLDD